MSAIKAAHLSRKAVIEVAGPDAKKFLNGQSCKNVERMGGGYSGFLNASGRVLHTVFILPIAPERYLITYDSTHPTPLTKLLPPYRVRSKVRFYDATAEWDVYASWGHKAEPWPQSIWKAGSGGAVERTWVWMKGIPPTLAAQSQGHGCWDLRGGNIGMQHLLMPKGTQPEADIVPEEEYNLKRMILGFPEGPEELIPGQALPLESCMDIQGGVNFRKGCYLGQELTVRTYHTGATRKRVLPLRFFPLSDPSATFGSLPAPSADPSTTLAPAGNITFHPTAIAGSSSSSSTSDPPTSNRPKSAGRVISQLSTVGLGVVRMEMAAKSWWFRNPQPKTVGEWLSGPRLTADIAGEEYGVMVNMGEAYGQAWRDVLDPARKAVELPVD